MVRRARIDAAYRPKSNWRRDTKSQLIKGGLDGLLQQPRRRSYPQSLSESESEAVYESASSMDRRSIINLDWNCGQHLKKKKLSKNEPSNREVVNGESRILPHVHQEHAFTPPLHFRIIESLRKTRQPHTFYHFMYHDLTNENTGTTRRWSWRNQTTSKKSSRWLRDVPKNWTMFRRRLDSYRWIVV